MLDNVAPGIWSVRIPMPNPHNPSVLCYLIEDAAGDLHLIDSGLPGDASLAVLEDALGSLGRALADVRSVSVTHLHLDHLGLAAAVRAAGGAVVRLNAEDAAALTAPGTVTTDELAGFGVPADLIPGLLRPMDLPTVAHTVIDQPLVDGELLEVPGRQLRVVHTPGHTWGHVCIVAEAERILFTGDHVLPDQFAGIGVGGRSPGNPVRAYRASLERLREFDGYTVLPGHGWTFDALGARIDETLEHHGRRTAEVAEVLAEQPDATVWQTAGQLTWSAGWDNLETIYRVSALRQTDWHRDIVRNGG